METGAGVPGYSGGLAASPNVFFGMRITGFVLADEDVSAPGPSMETGANVPGYSGGAERLSERLLGSGPDAGKRIRSRVLRDVAWGLSFI
jgi:hypothetical protein